MDFCERERRVRLSQAVEVQTNKLMRECAQRRHSELVTVLETTKEIGMAMEEDSPDESVS